LFVEDRHSFPSAFERPCQRSEVPSSFGFGVEVFQVF
jgi:hypothetical protein